MKLTDKKITEAMEFIKEQHNGELPYKFGTFECAKMMAKYAESKFNNGVLDDVSESVFPTIDDAREELENQNKEAGYPDEDDYSKGFDAGFLYSIEWINNKFNSR